MKALFCCKVTLAAIAMLSCSPLLCAETDFVWSNPSLFSYVEGQIATRQEVRDPCIIRDGDSWHLVFTMWPFSSREESRLGLPNNGSSPGIAMYVSKDLREWKFENWLVKASELPDDCPYRHRFWAPEIHKIKGKYYLIFTADNWTSKEANPAGCWGTAGYAFVGVADKVDGPYRNITYIDGAACDTGLFEGADGKTYAVIPRYNIDVQEIDLSGIEEGRVKLVGKPVTVVKVENDDIGIAVKPAYLEGPWVERVSGKYYLFYAAFHNDESNREWLGYHTGVAVSESPMGPYRKDPRGRIFTGGHLAVFDGPGGRKWFSYRGETDNGARGRLAIDPMVFAKSGEVKTKAPTLGPQREVSN